MRGRCVASGPRCWVLSSDPSRRRGTRCIVETVALEDLHHLSRQSSRLRPGADSAHGDRNRRLGRPVGRADRATRVDARGHVLPTREQLLHAPAARGRLGRRAAPAARDRRSGRDRRVARACGAAALAAGSHDVRQDFVAFDRLFHLPAPDLRFASTFAGPKDPWLAYGEEVLDAEVVHAIAPGAALTIVVTIASTDLHVSTYALTPAELLMVKMVGLIEIGGTDSYVRSPARSSGQATALQQAISTYAIAAGQWRAKLRAALAHGDTPSWVPSNTPSRRSEG